MSRPAIDQQVTFLYTLDLEATSRFYEDVMGLSLVLDQGSCRIYRVSGDSFLGFCQREEASREPKGIVFTFVTTAVDAWYEFLSGQGVDLEKRPQENSTYNIYHFFLRDPNGYLLEIQKFLNPNWPLQPTAAIS